MSQWLSKKDLTQAEPQCFRLTAEITVSIYLYNHLGQREHCWRLHIQLHGQRHSYYTVCSVFCKVKVKNPLTYFWPFQQHWTEKYFFSPSCVFAATKTVEKSGWKIKTMNIVLVARVGGIKTEILIQCTEPVGSMHRAPW